MRKCTQFSAAPFSRGFGFLKGGLEEKVPSENMPNVSKQAIIFSEVHGVTCKAVCQAKYETSLRFLCGSIGELLIAPRSDVVLVFI